MIRTRYAEEEDAIGLLRLLEKSSLSRSRDWLARVNSDLEGMSTRWFVLEEDEEMVSYLSTCSVESLNILAQCCSRDH